MQRTCGVPNASENLIVVRTRPIPFGRNPARAVSIRTEPCVVGEVSNGALPNRGHYERNPVWSASFRTEPFPMVFIPGGTL